MYYYTVLLDLLSYFIQYIHCTTSNIRTTHKYGNILQMKIEKYNYCMHSVKIYAQLDTNRHHTSAKIY
jgi:hypothetical protein